MKIRHDVQVVSLASLRGRAGGKNSGWVRTAFTPRERRYCRSNRMLLEHYGARLAAKRAVLKILGLKIRDLNLLRSIEIKKFGNGQPYVRLSRDFCRRQRLSPKIRIEISLAHERKFAIACALAVFP